MNRTTRALVDELVRAYPFPDPRRADRRGLLAYGGDLEPERLLAAYAQGVFPWYDEEPILWYSPDPRMVLLPSELHVGRSLAKRVRARPYVLSLDRAFGEVIRACAGAPRPGQGGTWIGDDMIEAYERLHALGFAHSVEAWAGEEVAASAKTNADAAGFDEEGELRLVGGLYGVSLGGAFFGESMFAREPDASKLAFVALVQQLERWGFDFVDCQVRTEHLARFGAREWPRSEFLRALERTLEGATRRGRWAFDSLEAGRS
ncbi:MAG: leucyl/phenylalanyl-tRNA--protein transferase [Deltaproteobacteria bacterium]|nr:leucyl/phenylalanyl-tRNA--protein transferase [Deltaproteobacteria bacterium]